jgi:hypothetical protein
LAWSLCVLRRRENQHRGDRGVGCVLGTMQTPLFCLT